MVKDIDIASYADDSTPFILENNIDNVIASLEQASNALFNWFGEQYIQVKGGKSLQLKTCF